MLQDLLIRVVRLFKLWFLIGIFVAGCICFEFGTRSWGLSASWGKISGLAAVLSACAVLAYLAEHIPSLRPSLGLRDPWLRWSCLALITGGVAVFVTVFAGLQMLPVSHSAASINMLSLSFVAAIFVSAAGVASLALFWIDRVLAYLIGIVALFALVDGD